MAPAAAPARLTILSWNVEDLPRRRDRVAAFGARAPIVCVQEVRVRPGDAAQVAAMKAAVPGHDCHASLCDDPRNVTFRGGRMYGVATYVARALGAIERRCAWDREGRVIISELPALGLAVVNVYAVNGTSKPYFDHALGTVDGDRHAWKRRFQQRIVDEGLALRARGLDLILVGDWNVSRTAQDTWPRLRTEEPHALARRHFNDELMPALDVVDVFRALHPDARRCTWFNRRTPPGRLDAARVDFALVSRALVDRVVDADLDEAPAARDGSDHAPLWVTLDVSGAG